MSNVCIFLSRIVVKTIDNIEKTVEYIRLSKDFKKHELELKEEELQSAPSIKSNSSSIETESQNSSTSTSISINKISEYGCSECFFKFRSFGLVKKHIDMCHKFSNEAKVINLTKNPRIANPLNELVHHLNQVNEDNCKNNTIKSDEIVKNKVTSTVCKQITLADKAGNCFTTKYMIKGFNIDLKEINFNNSNNQNVRFCCQKCSYSCPRFANFKRHLVSHQLKFSRLNKKSDLLEFKINNLKKNKLLPNANGNKNTSSKAIKSGFSRKALRSVRKNSKSSNLL